MKAALMPAFVPLSFVLNADNTFLAYLCNAPRVCVSLGYSLCALIFHFGEIFRSVVRKQID